MIIFLIILGVLVAALVIYVIIEYNYLTKLSLFANEAFLTLDIQLARRREICLLLMSIIDKDLNLDEFNNVPYNKKSIKEKIDESHILSASLERLVVQNDDKILSQNVEFKRLYDELKQVNLKLNEDKARHNKAILHYNLKLRAFPSAIIGKLFRFHPLLSI